jgi:hypothetical protein
MLTESDCKKSKTRSGDLDPASLFTQLIAAFSCLKNHLTGSGLMVFVMRITGIEDEHVSVRIQILLWTYPTSGVTPLHSHDFAEP